MTRPVVEELVGPPDWYSSEKRIFTVVDFGLLWFELACFMLNACLIMDGLVVTFGLIEGRYGTDLSGPIMLRLD